MKPIGNSLLNLGRVAVLPLVGLALAAPAIAQDDDPLLEEIVVVAQKREQNIMDVPVAITAVTGAQIEASGIKDVFDLQQNVPGLIVGRSQTATTSNFAIRGIGSTSNNFGVESSVGLYVDGVYRSRQSSMINELIDVYAAEVLRGPQGTLFGKNTASGAINIRTVAPDPDTPNAFVELTGGDLGLQRLSAAGNIRLSDNAAIRATVFSSQRDGYVDNYTYDFNAPSIGVEKDVFNNRDRWGARVQLAYDNDDDFNLRLIVDYAEIDEVCCAGISRIDALFAQDALTRGIVAPGSDAARSLDSSGALVGTTFTNFPYETYLGGPLPPTVVQGVTFEDYVTAQDILPVSRNEDQGISLEMNKSYDNGVTLTSVSAFRSFDTYDYIDIDFTDTVLADRYNDASQHSFSQEIRFAGEFGESSNWVAGAYYFQQTVKSNTRTTGGSDFPNYVFAVEPELTAFYTTLLEAGVPVTSPAPAGMFADDIVNQDHDGYAVFGQIDWALSDQFIATLGVRYTDETKKINTVYTQTHNAGEPNFAAIIGYLLGVPGIPASVLIPVTQDPGWGAYQYAPFSPRDNVNEKLEDDQVTGTAKLTWYPTDGQMVYASYSTGFKSGGTNADRIWDYLSQTFDAETSTSMEIGYKGDIGERMRLSVALYQTDYDDFQAQSFTGTGFFLQNAGKIETQGGEVEFLWQVLDNTTLSGFYARSEGDYKSFEEGVCWDAWSFHTQMDDPGLIPPGEGQQADEMPCNRTGGKIPYNPEDRYMVGLTQTFPVGAGEIFFRAEYNWASELFSDGDTDPLTKADDLGLLNLRLGMNFDKANASVTLWGRNVTDERYYTVSFDAPLQLGRMNSYPSEPSTYGITFNKKWE